MSFINVLEILGGFLLVTTAITAIEGRLERKQREKREEIARRVRMLKAKRIQKKLDMWKEANILLDGLIIESE
jgi:hypothetical protein